MWVLASVAFIVVCNIWCIPHGVIFVSDRLWVGGDCDVTYIHLIHCLNLLSVFSNSFLGKSPFVNVLFVVGSWQQAFCLLMPEVLPGFEGFLWYPNVYYFCSAPSMLEI